MTRLHRFIGQVSNLCRGYAVNVLIKSKTENCSNIKSSIIGNDVNVVQLAR